MVRSSHAIYKCLLLCLPKEWDNHPPLVWHWDVEALVETIWEFGSEEFEIESAWSKHLIDGLYDPNQNIIHTYHAMAHKPIAEQIIMYLHELAHANGYTDELQADIQAFRLFKLLNRKKPWKLLGIKTRCARRKSTSTLYDVCKTEPQRLPTYEPPWSIQPTPEEACGKK